MDVLFISVIFVALKLLSLIWQTELGSVIFPIFMPLLKKFGVFVTPLKYWNSWNEEIRAFFVNVPLTKVLICSSVTAAAWAMVR